MFNTKDTGHRYASGLQAGYKVRDIVVAGSPDFNSTIWFFSDGDININKSYCSPVMYQNKMILITDLIGIAEEKTGGISNSERPTYHQDVMDNIQEYMVQYYQELVSGGKYQFDLINLHDLYSQLVNLVDPCELSYRKLSHLRDENCDYYLPVVYTNERLAGLSGTIGGIEDLMLKENKIKDILFTQELLGKDCGIPLGASKIMVSIDAVHIKHIEHIDSHDMLLVTREYNRMIVNFTAFSCPNTLNGYNHLDYRVKEVIQTLCPECLGKLDRYTYFNNVSDTYISGVLQPRDLIMSIADCI